MENLQLFFQKLYKDFNERNIEAVILHMNKDVKWANAMEGGYVHGHDGVRDYWTRQFSMIDPNVTPLEISDDNDRIKVRVRQVVHDLDGQLLSEDIVLHFFRLQNHKVEQFDVEPFAEGVDHGTYRS